MARGRKSAVRLVLSSEERQTLTRWQRATTIAAGLVRRGKIVLWLAAGPSHSYVAQTVGVQRTVVRKWARRFLAQRLEGLADAPSRGATGGFSPEVALHVVRLACARPDPLGRSLAPWDCAELARPLIGEEIVEDISAATVRRILAAHHLKPWRHHVGLHPKQPRDAVFSGTVSELSDLYTRPLRGMRSCCPWLRRPPCSRVRDRPQPCQPGPRTCPTGTNMRTSGLARSISVPLLLPGPVESRGSVMHGNDSKNSSPLRSLLGHLLWLHNIGYVIVTSCTK
jgi:transposase